MKASSILSEAANFRWHFTVFYHIGLHSTQLSTASFCIVFTTQLQFFTIFLSLFFGASPCTSTLHLIIFWATLSIVQVLSVTLDEWTDDEIDAMVEVGGNASANSIYEAFIPEGYSKPSADSGHEERAKFIRLDGIFFFFVRVCFLVVVVF